MADSVGCAAPGGLLDCGLSTLASKHGQSIARSAPDHGTKVPSSEILSRTAAGREAAAIVRAIRSVNSGGRLAGPNSPYQVGAGRGRHDPAHRLDGGSAGFWVMLACRMSSTTLRRLLERGPVVLRRP